MSRASAQLALQPPSIGSAAPVMSAAVGPQRKTIKAATFSTGTKRRDGWRDAKDPVGYGVTGSKGGYAPWDGTDPFGSGTPRLQ